MVLVKTGVLALLGPGRGGGVLVCPHRPQLFDVFYLSDASRAADERGFFLSIYPYFAGRDYFLYCVPKWASLQDRLGCFTASAAAAAAAARFSLSRSCCRTAALSRRFVGRLEWEINGDEHHGGGRRGGAAALASGRREGKARRSDPGVLTCGCRVAL